MGNKESSEAFAPDTDAKRRAAADFLRSAMASGYDFPTVRTRFDNGRYAQSVLESALRLQARGEEIVHDPDELAQMASASFTEAAERASTVHELLEYRHWLDEAA